MRLFASPIVRVEPICVRDSKNMLNIATEVSVSADELADEIVKSDEFACKINRK